MKYSKFYLLILAVVMIMLSCSTKNQLVTTTKQELPVVTKSTISKDGFTINGKIKGMSNGQLKLSYEENGLLKKKTIIVTNGQFSVSGKVLNPHQASINIEGSSDYPVPFFLDNVIMTFEADKTNFKEFIITGSAVQEEFVAYNKLVQPFNDQFSPLYAQWDAAKSEEEFNSIGAQVEKVDKEMTAVTLKYIKTHPNSYVAATQVQKLYSRNQNIAELEELYNYLSPTIQASKIGQAIAFSIDVAKKTAIGQPAIELNVTDVKGKIIALSSLKGQYVLLDFWASWCGPCRAENPNIKKAYEAYHDKGFEIYAVSLDKSKEDWEKAITKDELPWLNVSDLQPENEAATMYGVQGIPMNFLLDKEGKIIAKNLSGEQLADKLATLF